MYITRHLEQTLLEAATQYPVIMLCGQRQVGKSTLLNHLKEPQRKYLSLDDYQVLSLALSDPKLFFETYPGPLIIDEIQRAPGLLLEIKRLVDDQKLRGQPCAGQFWLTGSQKFNMMPGITDSLVGRVAVLELPGLSRAEICGAKAELFTPDITALRERLDSRAPLDTAALYESIFTGCMPQVVTSELKPDRFYANYVYTYLERDVREMGNVGKLREFYVFLAALAARTAQELKYDELATIAGVSAPTVKTWISVLEAMGIVYILPPYASNLTKRLIKTPKLYFMDTGLVSYLCRWPDSLTLQYGAMDGAILENYVVTEIVKSYQNSGLRPDLYYYRDLEQREVDLLISKGDCLYPIEIKKNAHPHSPIRNFKALEKLSHKVMPGLIICLSDKLIPSSKELWLCPVAAL
ncbi:MAG: ATP-binding protein [Succinivibrio sp.]|nr:ATP-binding protein [Succinivibrio sp.]